MQNKHKKTKGRFSHLLRHLAWKQRGPILVSALHKFITYLLRHLPVYLQPRDPHGQILQQYMLLVVLVLYNGTHSQQLARQISDIICTQCTNNTT